MIQRIIGVNNTGMWFRALITSVFSVILALPALSQLKVEDFRSARLNDTEVVQLALDELDKQGKGSLTFDGSRTYQINRSLRLPNGKGSHFVLNGEGCTLRATADSVDIFQRIPPAQREALNEWTNTRFVIQDFTFVRGARGISLGASLGSAVLRCNFYNHGVAAVDVQFGLQTRIELCKATNCLKDNFVIRTGADWGGNDNNSQSNHTIIESCRVFARQGSESAYKVLGSGGVVISNCISEGHGDINYAIYADRQNSTTVRLFKIENFHLEHAPLKAGIYLRMSGVIEINGLFYQLARDEFTLVEAGRKCDLIHLMNVPHFVKGTVLRQDLDHGGASWNLMYCARPFYNATNWRVLNRNTNKYEERLPQFFSGQEGGLRTNKRY
jgi:hypothetical protein